MCGALANWEALDFDDAIEIAKEQIRKIRQGQVSYDPAQRSRWATPAMDALVGHSQLSTLQDDEEGGE